MKNYNLSVISEKNLMGVHEALVSVVRYAISVTEIDFQVIEGIRDMERQRQLVRDGKSRTLRSRHLTGHAVDIVPYVNNIIPWHDWSAFEQVACAMKIAALKLSIPVEWGGDWKSFKDGAHFQLCHKIYP